MFFTTIEHTLKLLGTFTTNSTGTVIQIADKCGLFKLLVDVLDHQLGKFLAVQDQEWMPLQNKILSFLHTCLPLVSLRTMSLVFKCGKIASDAEVC